MYSRNRGKLSRAELLIVDYELQYYRDHPRLPNDRIQRFATLEERLWMFRGTNDLWPSIIGYYWRTYGVVRSLDGWRRNWFMRQSEAVIGEDGRVEWRSSAMNDESTAQSDSPAAIGLESSLAAVGSLRTEYRNYLLRLVNLAREDRVRVVLVHIPLRDSVVDSARRKPSNVIWSSSQRVFRARQ